MKRDMDLVREILLEMEKWTPQQQRRGEEIKVSGHSPEEVIHHLGLMHEAGLIKAVDTSSHDGEFWIPVKILWDGHEFLAAAKSDPVWAKAKEHLMSTAQTVTLEGLKAALVMIMRRHGAGA